LLFTIIQYYYLLFYY